MGGAVSPAEEAGVKVLDKSYSFTDCTSFVVMRELGIREALTTDRHFVQAGFGIRP